VGNLVRFRTELMGIAVFPRVLFDLKFKYFIAVKEKVQ